MCWIGLGDSGTVWYFLWSGINEQQYKGRCMCMDYMGLSMEFVLVGLDLTLQASLIGAPNLNINTKQLNLSSV